MTTRAGGPASTFGSRQAPRSNWNPLLFLTSILLSTADAACFTIGDARTQLLVAGSLGIIQTAVILIVTRQYHPLNIFPLSMLLWMGQFPLASVLLTSFDLPLQWGVTPHYLGLATVTANLCQLVVAYVWQLPLWNRLAGNVKRPRFPSLESMERPFAVLWAVATVLRMKMAFSGYQAGFEVEAGTLNVMVNILYIISGLLGVIPIVYFCCLMNCRRRGYVAKAFVVIMVEVVMVSILSGSKAGLVNAILNFAVAYHYCVRPIRLRTTWIMLAVLLIVLVPFYALKAGVRDEALSNELVGASDRQKLTTEDYLFLYRRAFQNTASVPIWQMAQNTATAIVARLDVVTTLGATIAYYDARDSYDTAMYAGLWIKPYVPRFLWPDKGWVGLGVFVSSEILRIPTYTHAAVNSSVEGYVAGGLVGALVLAAINGALVSFASCYMTGRGSDKGLVSTFAGVYLVLLYFTSSFVFLRAIATNILFVWILAMILTRAGHSSGFLAQHVRRARRVLRGES